MWGAACNMDAIMAIARRHKLLVVEDSCQGVGGAYEGRSFGTIGDAGAFSFNYFKNMTCGEGGGVATSDDVVAERVRCAIDPCHFYWQGRGDGPKPFAGNGGRASEIMGAMLNVQLDRLDGMVQAMRAERVRILDGTAHLHNLGLKVAPMNSPEHDCGAHLMFQLPTAEQAKRMAELAPGVVAGKTGRHTYTEWDQVLMREGAGHPAMSPYQMPANAGCRMDYSRDMCGRSLDILDRTVMIGMHPLHTETQVGDIIHNIDAAARVALGHAELEDVEPREVGPVDLQKFDAAGR
jgi:dTDP-4-amino-4,6-dideoxygalactose transaminase